MNKPDNVELLIIRIQMLYDAAKGIKTDFTGLSEYEVLDTLVDTLKRQPNKPKLKVVE